MNVSYENRHGPLGLAKKGDKEKEKALPSRFSLPRVSLQRDSGNKRQKKENNFTISPPGTQQGRSSSQFTSLPQLFDIE